MGILLAPSAASAASYFEHFTLDSYHAGGAKYTPPASSHTKLKSALYVAFVQGTFSYYGAINYSDPQPPWSILCGTPALAPMFPSAGGSGKVGFDAEYVFARPWTAPLCAKAKLPVKWINFQMYSGSGAWSHPTPLVATTAPTASHSYEYAIVGEKAHNVKFRLYDIDTRDNYGSLTISLRDATPADCSGTKYLAFGLSKESECLAGLLPQSRKG